MLSRLKSRYAALAAEEAGVVLREATYRGDGSVIAWEGERCGSFPSRAAAIGSLPAPALLLGWRAVSAILDSLPQGEREMAFAAAELRQRVGLVSALGIGMCFFWLGTAAYALMG